MVGVEQDGSEVAADLRQHGDGNEPPAHGDGGAGDGGQGHQQEGGLLLVEAVVAEARVADEEQRRHARAVQARGGEAVDAAVDHFARPDQRERRQRHQRQPPGRREDLKPLLVVGVLDPQRHADHDDHRADPPRPFQTDRLLQGRLPRGFVGRVGRLVCGDHLRRGNWRWGRSWRRPDRARSRWLGPPPHMRRKRLGRRAEYLRGKDGRSAPSLRLERFRFHGLCCRRGSCRLGSDDGLGGQFHHRDVGQAQVGLDASHPGPEDVHDLLQGRIARAGARVHVTTSEHAAWRVYCLGGETSESTKCLQQSPCHDFLELLSAAVAKTSDVGGDRPRPVPLSGYVRGRFCRG